MNKPRLSPRLHDAAVVLPLVGVFLLMPPAITLFTTPYHVVGLPLIVVYLFGVWIALIACAAILARRISRGESDAGTGREAGPGQGDAQ